MVKHPAHAVHVRILMSEGFLTECETQDLG